MYNIKIDELPVIRAYSQYLSDGTSRSYERYIREKEKLEYVRSLRSTENHHG